MATKHMPKKQAVDDESGRQDDKPESQSSGIIQIVIQLFLLATWLLFVLLVAPRSTRRENVSYSEFVRQVETGQVETALVGSQTIEYTLKPTASTTLEAEDPTVDTFMTVPLSGDTTLPDLLRKNNVEVTAVATEGSGWTGGFWGLLFPILILFFLWNFVSGRVGGRSNMLGIGKSTARIYSENGHGVTLDDVAGVDEAKDELKEIIDYLRDAERYTRLGARIPKGILLVGPPGTGKTLLARAIAGQAAVPFFSISASEFIEMFVGVGASRVRDLFEQAKRKAPCIIFIDELDGLGKSRAAKSTFAGNDEREQTLNQLLAEMDGFEPNVGVILLAATNRPEVLDPALLRAGRFDRQIVIDRPDRKGREAILQIHAQQVQLADDVRLRQIAAKTPGFAGADLANLVNEAALLAARSNQDVVRMADFNEAIERVMTGLEKKSRVLNELEKRTVAYHEAGHAIIGAVTPGAGKVEKISIVPRGIAALGYTLQLPEDDRFLMMEDEIKGRLVTLLGGRAAEELVFNRISTGASDDIQKATDLVERCITLYGMSKTLGPVAIDRTQSQFLEGNLSPKRSISPRLAEAIDDEIKSTMEEAHTMALEILLRNRNVLERIAQALLEEESLEGSRLELLLTDIQSPTNLSHWLDPGHFETKQIDARSLMV